MIVQAGVTANGPQGENSDSLDLTESHFLPEDATVLVTNCASGVDVFRNGATASTSLQRPTTAAGGWSTAYDESMQVFENQVVAYFVGVDDQGVPGLYRSVVRCDFEETQELVRGVESMQVLYGYSRAAPFGTGQSVDDWLTADEVPADGWPQVIAVEVGVSVRSSEVSDGDPTTQTFTLSRANIETPGDGLMRHPFSTTIALRNRLVMP